MSTDPYRERRLALDDPRIEPLQERIHAARGHDWQPACGQCYDKAYEYLETDDILAAPLTGTGRDRMLDQMIASGRYREAFMPDGERVAIHIETERIALDIREGKS